MAFSLLYLAVRALLGALLGSESGVSSRSSVVKGRRKVGCRRRSGEHCVVPSAACYEDALTEAVEGGQAVGSSLDHFDLVGHRLRVAVGDRLVEVGEQFFAPEPDAFWRRR